MCVAGYHSNIILTKTRIRVPRKNLQRSTTVNTLILSDDQMIRTTIHLLFVLKFVYMFSAYDILSDEQKRKNYDLYGDERVNPGFDGGNPGEQGGYTYFSSGGPSGFSFRPGEWQNMGGQGGSKSFSFSFGGPGSGSSGFGLDDIFSNFFGGGMGGGSQFNGFSSSGRPRQGSKSSAKNIPSVNTQLYRKEIVDSGMTWLLLAYTSNLQGIQHYQSVIEEVGSSLQGAMKVLHCFYRIESEYLDNSSMLRIGNDITCVTFGVLLCVSESGCTTCG